jgi:hypothetical protein
MLQDIQEDILNLSADPESLAFLPLSVASSDSSDKATKDAATCTTRRCKVSILITAYHGRYCHHCYSEH